MILLFFWQSSYGAAVFSLGHGGHEHGNKARGGTLLCVKNKSRGGDDG